jgi:hypothetical protein
VSGARAGLIVIGETFMLSRGAPRWLAIATMASGKTRLKSRADVARERTHAGDDFLTASSIETAANV